MGAKHSTKRVRKKTPFKIALVATVIGVTVAAMIFFLSRRPAGKVGVTGDDSAIGVGKDENTPSDAHDEENTADVSDWIEHLTDEQKAELDIAYEASVEGGYQGTYDEWVASEVQTRVNGNGNVVATLPDGGEFTVTMHDVPGDNQKASNSKDNDADKKAEESNNGQGSSAETGNSGGDNQPPDASSPDKTKQSALLVVDTVTAHRKDKRVALPIKILGNPGVLGLTFSVSYDEQALTLVEVDNGKAFEGILALTHSRTYASGCLFTWDGVDIEPDQVRDGVVLTLFFDVADDASGLKSVVVRGVTGFDADLNNVDMTTQDGGIAVE